MWCLNLVCSVISQLKPVNTYVPVIWFLLKEMKSLILSSLTPSFSEINHKSLNYLERLTSTNKATGFSVYCPVSHSYDYIWWFLSRSLIALHCDCEDATNLLFSRMRASKYYWLHTEKKINAEILFTVESHIFLQTWRTSKWNFQDNGTIFGKYIFLGCLFS